MHLSKVQITDPRVRNPYEIHRLLWQVFPDRESASRDFLFRVEKKDVRTADILLQSEIEPVAQGNVAVMASKTFNPVLAPGQGLRFRLLANAVKSVKDEKGRVNSRGEIKQCRVPLVTEEDQLHWLHRKLGKAARIEHAVVQHREAIFFRRKQRPGKLVTLTFEGVLQVTDPEKLTELVRLGIGPAKSFGCGLLSLAKA